MEDIPITGGVLIPRGICSRRRLREGTTKRGLYLSSRRKPRDLATDLHGSQRHGDTEKAKTRLSAGVERFLEVPGQPEKLTTEGTKDHGVLGRVANSSSIHFWKAAVFWGRPRKFFTRSLADMEPPGSSTRRR